MAMDKDVVSFLSGFVYKITSLGEIPPNWKLDIIPEREDLVIKYVRLDYRDFDNKRTYLAPSCTRAPTWFDVFQATNFSADIPHHPETRLLCCFKKAIYSWCVIGHGWLSGFTLCGWHSEGWSYCSCWVCCCNTLLLFESKQLDRVIIMTCWKYIYSGYYNSIPCP